MRLLPLCCLASALAACGEPPTPAPVSGSEDFFLLSDAYMRVVQARERDETGDCRARIASIMCVTDGAPMAAPETWPPPPPVCLPGSSDYAPVFQTLYDALPPRLQEVMCQLGIIVIEPGFAATGAAGGGRGPDGELVASMIIRKEFMDNPLSLATWASWKEQLSFGGPRTPQLPDARLPLVAAATPVPHDMHFFVVAHELGHVLDFSLELNAFDPSPDQVGDGIPDDPWGATPRPGSWGALSWDSMHTPLPEADFPHRADLCFYFCLQPVAPDAIPALYAGLDRSPFISTYAATNPHDDLADSVAYYALSQNKSAYWLDTRQGAVYDVMAKLDSPVWAAKRQYLQDLLSKSATD